MDTKIIIAVVVVILLLSSSGGAYYMYSSTSDTIVNVTTSASTSNVSSGSSTSNVSSGSSTSNVSSGLNSLLTGGSDGTSGLNSLLTGGSGGTSGLNSLKAYLPDGVTAAPVKSTYTPTTNTDYKYNDIKYYKGPFSECAAECDKIPGCVGYVTHKNKGENCWLKSKLETPNPSTNRDTYVKSVTPSTI